MPTVPSPQTVLDRVRRDVERNALRARNGIKLVIGSTAPVWGTPPRTSSGSGAGPALALPNDPDTHGGGAARCSSSSA